MREKIIIAGAGGQGIMLLGKVLTEAAMRENKHVTWMPCYGAEVRGGTAYCMVTISEQPIGSPIIEKADSAILMNEPSFERFKTRIRDNGVIIVNSSLVREARAVSRPLVSFPFTEIAVKLGNPQVANMVALGCLVAATHIVDAKSILRVFREIAPEEKKDLIAINRKALITGVALLQKKGKNGKG